jgi:Zn-dependent M28 family amino/carboxypeptidase
MITASYLRKFFNKYGLSKFYSDTYTQSFIIDSLTNGRNIIGVIPSLYYSDEYILISAHYDHLGIIGGSIYNGADDNASGVASILTIVELYSQMRMNREGPKKNILVALYDAKESSMAGSKYFIDNLPIDPSKIKYSINIDQIGCTFSPPGENQDYILYLASKSIRYDIRRRIDMLNNFHQTKLEIDHSFYDSPAFYELFFKTSDQINSHNAGIPSIMFTSGIHMHTYKPTDRYYFINK